MEAIDSIHNPDLAEIIEGGGVLAPPCRRLSLRGRLKLGILRFETGIFGLALKVPFQAWAWKDVASTALRPCTAPVTQFTTSIVLGPGLVFLRTPGVCWDFSNLDGCLPGSGDSCRKGVQSLDAVLSLGCRFFERGPADSASLAYASTQTCTRHLSWPHYRMRTGPMYKDARALGLLPLGGERGSALQQQAQ